MLGVGPHVGWSVADECAGWLNGTLDTWLPADLARHRVKPGGFTSQSMQDKWLFEHFFRKMYERSERNGRTLTYVDVAANHYKRISNTYFYDACLKWRGLCVEPNPIYHDDLRRFRTCDLVPTCASDATAEIDLVLPPHQWLGGMGGVAGGTLATWASRAYPKAQWREATRRLRCVKLGDELERRGLTHIDFMSLDVEGHEESVLRGIDFSRIKISHILCEAGCERILLPLGYTSVKRDGEGGTERLYVMKKAKGDS